MADGAPHRAVGAHIAVAAALGTISGAAVAAFVAWQAAELIGWNVAALFYVGSLWGKIGGLDAHDTKRVAVREDPSIPASELVMLSAAVACLGGVGMALIKAGQSAGGTKAFLIALAVASVVAAWSAV